MEQGGAGQGKGSDLLGGPGREDEHPLFGVVLRVEEHSPQVNSAATWALKLLDSHLAEGLGAPQAMHRGQAEALAQGGPL